MAKTNIHILFITINIYHSTFLHDADPDSDENSDGSTDLDQKIEEISGFPYPYSPLSIKYSDVVWHLATVRNSITSQCKMQTRDFRLQTMGKNYRLVFTVSKKSGKRQIN